MSSLKPNHRTLSDDRVELPERLRAKLAHFRGSVCATKLAESLLTCLVVGLTAFLVVYVLDRRWNTPWSMLWILLATALAVWSLVPAAIYRWVWNSRGWDQIARMIRQRNHALGDELLSAIELAASRSEQSRSPELCHAAVQQVAERAMAQDFRHAAPRHFLRPLAMVSIVCLSVVLALFWLFPLAATNAWYRFSRPWNPPDRYTFVSVQPLPDSWVVPHGEPSLMVIGLSSDSARVPSEAILYLSSSSAGVIQTLVGRVTGDPDRQSKALAEDAGGTNLDGHIQTGCEYHIHLPPLVSPTPVRVVVGDFAKKIIIEPKMRPELTSLTAEIALPAYLQMQQIQHQDVRAGVLSAVEGSSVQLVATTSSELESAWIASQSVPVDGAGFRSETASLGADSIDWVLNWRDIDGLSGRHPFTVNLQSFPDEIPSIATQDLPRQAVVLETEQINFRALAADDFGVKQVGIAWKGLDHSLVSRPAEGQRVISGGGPSQTALQVPATFCAAALGISAQPIEVTVWVQDYFPDRPPVHSVPHLLYVLTPDEHAIWITTQISKWHRSALDVRDTEMRLFQANQQLRSEFADQATQQDLGEEIRRQAALEEANGRKLSALTQSGAELLRQAARNPDLAVENLEQLAQMLNVLGDIANTRMPSVADLLKQASAQSALPGEDSLSSAQSPQRGQPPQVGQVRATPQSDGSSSVDSKNDNSEGDDPDASSPNMLAVPAIVDIESNMNLPEAINSVEVAQNENKPEGDSARLGLPQTTLIGPKGALNDGEEPSNDQPSPEDLAKNKPLDKALSEQLDLLSEFEKIADQMNAVLGNLEGSTLVKRLKAASREQGQVADRIASRIETIFGRSKAIPEEDHSILASLSQSQHQSSQSVSFIMDDMQAYFDRRKIPEIKMVLDEMRSSEVLTALKKLGDDLPIEHGLSIAQAEYWADTLDRWAEDLVESDDSKSESDEDSSESKDSMPPRLILEMLRILEGEVNLREETRVAQQASSAMDADQHHEESLRLSEVQSDLRRRTNALVDEIAALPEAELNFGQETLLFSTVSQVMEEARLLLSLGNTGSATVAAQTEVIELLLQSKRVNPQGGGGGGGTSPGGGGTGTTEDSALALLGAGLNPNQQQEGRDVGQGVGKSSERVFPEEFRGGLDAYFQLLENGYPIPRAE